MKENERIKKNKKMIQTKKLPIAAHLAEQLDFNCQAHEANGAVRSHSTEEAERIRHAARSSSRPYYFIYHMICFIRFMIIYIYTTRIFYFFILYVLI